MLLITCDEGPSPRDRLRKRENGRVWLGVARIAIVEALAYHPFSLGKDRNPTASAAIAGHESNFASTYQRLQAQSSSAENL